MTRPKRLQCGCCGSSAFGRQHWNHDTGFGLCAKCAMDFAANPAKYGDELSGYGTPGHNFAMPLHADCQPGALVSWKTLGGEVLSGTLKEWDNGTAIIRDEDNKEHAIRGR